MSPLLFIYRQIGKANLTYKMTSKIEKKTAFWRGERHFGAVSGFWALFLIGWRCTARLPQLHAAGFRRIIIHALTVTTTQAPTGRSRKTSRSSCPIYSRDRRCYSFPADTRWGYAFLY